MHPMITASGTHAGLHLIYSFHACGTNLIHHHILYQPNIWDLQHTYPIHICPSISNTNTTLGPTHYYPPPPPPPQSQYHPTPTSTTPPTSPYRHHPNDLPTIGSSQWYSLSPSLSHIHAIQPCPTSHLPQYPSSYRLTMIPL